MRENEKVEEAERHMTTGSGQDQSEHAAITIFFATASLYIYIYSIKHVYLRRCIYHLRTPEANTKKIVMAACRVSQAHAP